MWPTFHIPLAAGWRRLVEAGGALVGVEVGRLQGPVCYSSLLVGGRLCVWCHKMWAPLLRLLSQPALLLKPLSLSSLALCGAGAQSRSHHPEHMPRSLQP